MKRILVPTDFSEQAENALKVAAQMAKKNGSQIYILNSLELPSNPSNSGSSGAMPESLFFIKLAEKHFEELLEKPYLEDLLIHEAIIGHGEIYNDVSEVVKEKDIDLIIMGSHGINGFMEMFIGSNTEKVVRTSKIPVLVIKNEHLDFKTDNFVYATDFSEECKAPFKEAQKFAEMSNSHLNLLYVNTPSGFKTTQEINKRIKDFIKDFNKERINIHIYNDSSIEKGILNFANETNANLIGMGTHGRKGISHFFNGSVSEDLVNHANMPVMTFKI
jgi:nucleotide-binding universal stress UspA family protein